MKNRNSWIAIAAMIPLIVFAIVGLGRTQDNTFPPSDALALAPEKDQRCVRIIYMVSKDREVKKEYVQAIEKAAVSVRKWYASRLEGRTFDLHKPIVEVVKSDKEAKWFTENPNGSYQDNWGFLNTLAEAKRLLDYENNRSRFIYVIYSDGPGDKGRAIPGFVYLPEDDLLGLVGKHPQQKDQQRWVGGLAHELGHGLGLKHPKDTKKDYSAIMWAGFYGKYPVGAYLTEEDKGIFGKSPYIRRLEEDSADSKEKQ